MSDQRFEVLAAAERDMLEAMLDFHRDAMLRKTSDVSDDQLRASPVASGTNLIGLVHHLTRVEEWWFEGCFAGRPFDGDPPHEHQAPVGATYEEVVAGYRRQCERSREIARQAQLDDVAAFPSMMPTLRWVLVHMIEETARHNGQADVIRELTDGATGE